MTAVLRDLPAKALLGGGAWVVDDRDERGHPTAIRWLDAEVTTLVEADYAAAHGDAHAARLARFHTDHPDGPQTPEAHAERAALTERTPR